MLNLLVLGAVAVAGMYLLNRGGAPAEASFPWEPVSYDTEDPSAGFVILLILLAAGAYFFLKKR